MTCNASEIDVWRLPAPPSASLSSFRYLLGRFRARVAERDQGQRQDRTSAAAAAAGDHAAQLRHTRVKALLLLGFWRGFRFDELTRLQGEHIDAVPGEE